MLNSETKKHIDAARQVLVGVVPNPTVQIDQITNALIYKFMDDMDQSAIKAGGDPSFFKDDLEKYAWTRLMDSKLGNQDRMNLYQEALEKFSSAKQLPDLFRDIFKSAYLPYRSPETLGLFLKEIGYFDYSHSEELGNAYEYLLSVMGSQGDAGQFRTPRNIIDFIVKVVNPTKDDKILDPASGTAGFLISAYKNILEQHDGKDDPEKKEKSLSPDQKRKLVENFEGYDIDPGMVRIAQVNMYLHQFKNPKIVQYDSLSMDERWNDKFDVILANPPFMSPKGGMKPHSKFSIQSTRSEVLFVDYIMNHLKPKGRAGVIVPEGIIFQSGASHKQLRKNIVEDGLFAVVSLPSGVFNPYAGVKTSILLFDKDLAKQRTELLFIKIEKDGYDLGAQRRPLCSDIENGPEWCEQHSNLPQALKILEQWKAGDKVENKLVLYVDKSQIAENGDYNLSVDRYRISTDHTNTKWPSLKLKELEESGDITLGRGQVISKKDLEANPGIYPVYSSSAQGIGEFGQYGNFMFDEELITWSVDGGGRFFYRPKHKFSVTNVSGWLRINNPQKINAKYLFRVLDTEWQNKTFDYVAKAHPSVIREMYKIPLPPLEIQEQIVAELDGYAGIITGAEKIVKNWKPKIDIDTEWEKVKLEEITDLITKGTTPTTNGDKFTETGVNFIKVESLSGTGEIELKKTSFISEKCHESLKRSQLKENDILFSIAGTKMGISAIVPKNILPANTNQALAIIRLKNEDDSLYILNYLRSMAVISLIENIKVGVAQFNLSLKQIGELEIPFPPLKVREQIVKKIEDERILVEASKRLIEIYEQKTKKVISKLWEA